MRRLADPLFVGTITQHWLKPDAPSSWPEDAYLILRVLADIADLNSDRPELQQQIWDLVMTYYIADPQRIGGQLYVGGDLAPRINDSRVIPDLLTKLLTPEDGTEGGERATDAASWPARWLRAVRSTRRLEQSSK